MPTATSTCTSADGYLVSFGDVGDHTVSTGDDIWVGNTSSTDGTQYNGGYFCNTATDFAGITVGQITQARFKYYINAVLNPGAGGNTGTFEARVNNALNSALTTTDGDYKAGTLIETTFSPTTGLVTVIFTKTLINLAGGTNSGFTNIVHVCVNDGLSGSDPTYIHVDSATKAGGVVAKIEIDYTLGSASTLMMMGIG